MPYLITTAGKYNGRSYILFMVSIFILESLESWKARKLESLESHQKAKSRGEKERKKAVVLSTVLYYEWMPI